MSPLWMLVLMLSRYSRSICTSTLLQSAVYLLFSVPEPSIVLRWAPRSSSLALVLCCCVIFCGAFFHHRRRRPESPCCLLKKGSSGLSLKKYGARYTYTSHFLITYTILFLLLSGLIMARPWMRVRSSSRPQESAGTALVAAAPRLDLHEAAALLRPHARIARRLPHTARRAPPCEVYSSTYTSISNITNGKCDPIAAACIAIAVQQQQVPAVMAGPCGALIGSLQRFVHKKQVKTYRRIVTLLTLDSCLWMVLDWTLVPCVNLWLLLSRARRKTLRWRLIRANSTAPLPPTRSLEVRVFVSFVSLALIVISSSSLLHLIVVHTFSDCFFCFLLLFLLSFFSFLFCCCVRLFFVVLLTWYDV